MKTGKSFLFIASLFGMGLRPSDSGSAILSGGKEIPAEIHQPRFATSPKDFGMSATCRRMVRKSRYRQIRAGLRT